MDWFLTGPVSAEVGENTKTSNVPSNTLVTVTHKQILLRFHSFLRLDVMTRNIVLCQILSPNSFTPGSFRTQRTQPSFNILQGLDLGKEICIFFKMSVRHRLN